MPEIDLAIAAVLTEIDQEPATTPRLEMRPEEAIEKLRRGEAIENARIARLRLRGEFANPIRLRNCMLVKLEFDGAVFKGDVSITNCTLDRPIFNRSTVFEQNFTLDFSIIHKSIMRAIVVKGSFGFANVQAKGKLMVTDCRFEGKSRFWEANLNCWVDFNQCEFAQEADFRSMHIAEGLVLTQCHFRGDFLFRGSSIHKKFQLDSSTFEGLIDLSKAKLHDFVYMETIHQGEKQRFAFLNALGERVLVKPEQVEGRVHSEQNGRYDDAMCEYGFLKKSYAHQHRYDMEDWAFYRFKVNQRFAVDRTWQRPWTRFSAFCNWLFLDIGCGYGTNPARAVRMALAIIIGFALLYMFNIDMFFVDEKRPFMDQDIHSWPNRISTSVMLSVSVFTSGLTGIRDLAKEWMTIPLIIESLLGTFLWGLFIVAFSRKVIR